MLKRENQRFRMLPFLVLVCGAMCGAARAGCEPSWQPFVSGGQTGVLGADGLMGFVYTMTHWNDDLIVGGWFSTAGGQNVNNIARWDGSSWHPFTVDAQTGVNGVVWALTVWNGELVVGGTFTTAGGQIVNNIARWDGSSWHPLGSDGGVGVGDGSVLVLTAWNGDLVAGGKFATAGGQAVNGIARWDGTAWHAFVSDGEVGLGGAGSAMALTIWNGDLVVGGLFATAGNQEAHGIARWDGSTWHPFTDGKVAGVSGSVNILTVWNGDLIVGGGFIVAGQQEVRRIARWDGSWHSFPCSVGGPGLVFGEVRSLAIWNNDLIAGGEISGACAQVVNRIARWDSSVWHPFIANGQIGLSSSAYAVTVWNDNVVVGGQFLTAGGTKVHSIVRWSCPIPIPGDINGDGLINVIDLLTVINNWGACGNPNDCPADVAPPGGDDQVNVQDLLFIINNWG